MKIAAYEVRRDEQKDFAFIAEKRGVELTETEDILTLENIDTVNGAEGVTTLGRTRFDRALLTAVRERGVKYISTRTIGADHIDLTAAKELGLKVCNSNYAPNGVADYTVMLMLLSLRKYKPALWRAQVNDYSLAGLQGRELRNLTVGILGTGKIVAANSPSPPLSPLPASSTMFDSSNATPSSSIISATTWAVAAEAILIRGTPFSSSGRSISRTSRAVKAA